MRTKWWPLAASMALCACDGSSTGSEPGTPGIRFVAGNAATDTVDAILATPLTVEVRDGSGRPAVGVAVFFDAQANLAVGTPPVTGAALTTDASGRASVVVRMGHVAGEEGRVAVSVPGLGYADTARFTILAGQPAQVAALLEDTAVIVGRGFTLRGQVQDRYGNPRAETPTWTAGPANVSVTGAALTGQSIGRGYALARYGAFTDTAWVSVVPAGVLVAYEFPVYSNGTGPADIRQPGRIVRLNTDGSGYTVLLEQQPAVVPFSYAEGMHPALSPVSEDVAYINGQRLMLLKAGGETREVFSAAPVHAELTPQWSPDGAWIYFSRIDGSRRTFWRVRPDGTGAQQVSPADDLGMDLMPSPDPTGEWVAFQTNRSTHDLTRFTIRTLRLSTGGMSTVDVPGQSPHWSPTGEWIAYVANDPYDPGLWLVHPDGTGAQKPGGRTVGAHPAFSWSPDGKWLAISGNQPRERAPSAVGLWLVNVATGEALPIRLSFGHTVVQPSWHR